jgi:hypothetical protein
LPSFRIITDLRLAEFQLGLVWPVTLAGPETVGRVLFGEGVRSCSSRVASNKKRQL